MTPKRIILHHSLTADSGTVSWGAIRHYHMTAPEYGYDDIGYHAGVELVKSGAHEYYEVLLGRAWDRMGAHARGHNYDSLGLCFIGNFDLTEPPMGQLIVGVRLVAYWMRQFGIVRSSVYGHREFNAGKTCPGSMFDLDMFRGMLP